MPKDYPIVSILIQEAFMDDPHGANNEHLLVSKLRKSPEFIPELSIVALKDGNIVGHILLSKITIRNAEEEFPSLALAPVSVKSAFQQRGIGSQLILFAHQKAKALGYGSIILIGHETYYPRFGYKPCKNYGITLPFEVPEANAMAVELSDGSLNNIHGMVEYPEVFFE